MSSPASAHFYVLLDRSGSMESMREAVISGVNRLLTEQQANGSNPARMTLVQFDSDDPHEVLAEALPVAELVPLTAATFVPRGMTPLLDATGRVIAMAGRRAEQRRAAGEEPEDITIVTITDGQENQSREFTRGAVVELVRAREAGGWTFVFLGAGLDAYGEAGGIGYDARSVQAWAPDAVGASAAFDSLSHAMTARRRKLARRQPIDRGDFFEGAKPAEADRHRRTRSTRSG